VEKETAEMNLILSYLPQPYSDDEYLAAIRTAVDSLGAKGKEDMGKACDWLSPTPRPILVGRPALFRAGARFYPFQQNEYAFFGCNCMNWVPDTHSFVARPWPFAINAVHLHGFIT
jgi:hypothetical protein